MAITQKTKCQFGANSFHVTPDTKYHKRPIAKGEAMEGNCPLKGNPPLTEVGVGRWTVEKGVTTEESPSPK